MNQNEKPTKSHFPKSHFAVAVCIFCIWIIKSGTIDIDGVKAGILKQVVKVDPNKADAHLFLGDHYADLYHYEEAIRVLKEAIKANPEDATKCSELGDLNFYLGHNEEAVKVYQQAIRIQPGNARTHYKLAKVYLDIGNKDLALQEYEILKTLDEELAKEVHDFIEQ